MRHKKVAQVSYNVRTHDLSSNNFVSHWWGYNNETLHKSIITENIMQHVQQQQDFLIGSNSLDCKIENFYFREVWEWVSKVESAAYCSTNCITSAYSTSYIKTLSRTRNKRSKNERGKLWISKTFTVIIASQQQWKVISTLKKWQKKCQEKKKYSTTLQWNRRKRLIQFILQ